MPTLLPIIQPQELIALAKGDLVIITAGAGSNALLNYERSHLKGALFVDLNIHLATVPQDAANGGRHPLPSIESFARTLGRLGISPQSNVVVYDDKNGANAAARFWWMLRAAGHIKVHVLNGGISAATEAGFPISNAKEIVTPADPYTFTEWQLPIASINEVEAASENSHALIIDVRDAYRYRGESEPIDLVAGHIPGAVNIPFSSNLAPDGLFLSANTLREKYIEALGNVKSGDIIVHCGSGVTACHTLLAMDYAGLPLPKLYVGSWGEGSRNGKNIATGL